MDRPDFPRIRIELDYMKQQMVAAVVSQTTELVAGIKGAVEQAIDEFDVVAFVKREAVPMIQAEIRRRLSSAIDEAVSVAWTKNSHLTEWLKRAAAQAVEERVTKEVERRRRGL
jgi:hypothetical protein